MIKKNKGLVFGLFAFLLMIVSGFVLGGCSNDKGESVAYIDNVAEFNLKFQTERVIYVDDLDFEAENVWNVNRSIKFVGKREKSTIKNVYINITAPSVGGERIKIAFENIIFDGSFDKGTTDLTQEDTFENILGNRDNKHCITACRGHYDLTIENCEFTNYASEYGSVIYVDNYLETVDYKVITLNNSKFYNNICTVGTVKIDQDKADVKITNCEFFENYGAIGTGFDIGNGKLLVDNCTIKDNTFCKFDIEDESGQTAGGGVCIGAFDGKMSNTKIINNKSVFGGGLAVISNPTGDNKMIIENCTIKNNTATKNGGGVIINSKAGQTISFIGCEISFNKAPSSASVYSIPMQGWNLKEPKTGNLIKTGNINFFFCKIAMNEGEDNKGITTDLDYYVSFNPTELPNASQKGNTQIKGCIIIDDTTLTANEGDYNYIATQSQAEIDGVIDSAQIANSLDKNLCLLDNNKTNIVVPASVYSKWNMEFVGANKGTKIGEFTRPVVENANNTALIISLTITAILVVSVGAVLVVMQKNKKALQTAGTTQQCEKCISEEISAKASNNKMQITNENMVVNNQENNCSANMVNNEETTPIEQDEIVKVQKVCAMLIKQKVLSKREAGIVELIMQNKKINEMHEILFISRNTIKYHIKNIYAKLSVKTREELRARIEAEMQNLGK